MSNDKLQEWEDYYNYHRPHGALDGQTPYESDAACRQMTIISEWLQYKPNDSANQLAVVWHAYFTTSQKLTAAQGIKAAGYPVIIPE